MKKLPIVAVIPAYNAADRLPELLDELIRQKYDQIFVLDDHSSDSTLQVLRTYKDAVNIIEGQSRVGSGANRNRIIGKARGSILHFIDADVRLISKQTPEIIGAIRWPNDAAYFGGTVRNPDGTQNPFNWGPRASFATTMQSYIQYSVWRVGWRHQKIAASLRWLLQPCLHAWPNIYRLPHAREVFWASEANMIIESDFFESIGGYDPTFKYAEINDLSVRLRRQGLKTMTCPEVDVLHLSVDNIFHRRQQKLAAHKLFIKKYGYLNYCLPRLADYFAASVSKKQ